MCVCMHVCVCVCITATDRDDLAVVPFILKTTSSGFVRCAHQYRLHGSSIEDMCHHNAQVCVCVCV